MKDQFDWYINILNEGLTEELCRTIFSSPISFKLLIEVVNDDKFNYLQANNTYIENSDLQREDIIGRTPYDIFDRSTADSIQRHCRECVRKKQAINYRETIMFLNGEKHFITSLIPILKDGRVKYIFGEKLDSTMYINEIKKNQEYEKTITENYNLMQSLFDISVGFTKSDYNNFERQVDKSLVVLGKHLNCDQIGIYKFFQDDNYANCIKRWFKDQNEQDVFGQYEEELTTTILKRKNLLPNINGSTAKQFVNIYQKTGIDCGDNEAKSVLSVPVLYNKEIWGYITYFYFHQQKEWQDHEVETLMLFGDIFINTFFRVDAEKKLRLLSEKDNLTGLDNRLSLARNIKMFDDQEYLPFAFVYIDVNGLKMTNDCFGHNMGDKLLMIFAGILKQIAGDYYPTRISGDEFALLCPNVVEKDLKRLIESIKVNCKNIDSLPVPLSISVGYAVRNKLELSMEELSEKAENNMYREKTLESKTVKNNIMQHIIKKTQSGKVHSREYHLMVSSLAQKLAQELKLRDLELEKLGKAVLFYNIGYALDSEEVIYDNDNQEANLLKTHCEKGYHIAMAMPFLQPVAEIILSHHENWDGSGYPQGLQGKEIPFISRIIALIDAYVLMIMGKPGTKPLSKNEAIEEIEKKSGSFFDPKIVKVFVNILKEDR